MSFRLQEKFVERCFQKDPRDRQTESLVRAAVPYHRATILLLCRFQKSLEWLLCDWKNTFKWQGGGRKSISS
jgi:hypothetical protein